MAAEESAASDEIAEALAPLSQSDEIAEALAPLCQSDEITEALAPLCQSDEITEALAPLCQSDEIVEALVPVSASDEIGASYVGWSLAEVEAACSSISEVEEPPEKMEPAKMAPLKNAPRDALVMAQILKDMGITEYEPRVINQMLEFAFRYVTTILDDAKIYSSHAKKPTVDADDVRLAIQCRADQSFTSPPPRDFLLDIARQKNQTPLPLIKPYAGPRLPPDRYCLTAPNYRLKSLIKKGPNQGRLVPRLSVGAVSSRPTTPTVEKTPPQAVSVPNKVATPVSVTSQRFAVQIPPSQSTPAKPGGGCDWTNVIGC
ncbi:Transcription initiation factor TFIID subunit 9B [Apodemus speciosus]|uniref:Transcription initiation factor TFIID subunit 9B n=1 Tax=Apodemus speciosus TaxID=105296 RepID=A0ABQ0FUZ3_APOSI